MMPDTLMMDAPVRERPNLDQRIAEARQEIDRDRCAYECAWRLANLVLECIQRQYRQHPEEDPRKLISLDADVVSRIGLSTLDPDRIERISIKFVAIAAAAAGLKITRVDGDPSRLIVDWSDMLG